MKYRWQLFPSQPLLADSLAAKLGVSPLLAQCLINRGLDDAENASRFLQPQLKQLSDPFLLPDMQTAVDRLFAARKRNEPIVLFGDYDVDGVTSVAMLYELLTALGWRAHCFLPHRLDEGYGLSLEAVRHCLEKTNASLFVAVDCGTSATEAIAWLAERKREVIVVDHHQPGGQRPNAVAIVNPQLDPAMRFSELCAAGLSFKLAHAIVKQGRTLKLPEFASYDVRPMLDLVALGTVADVVPLTGENRILVTAGLRRLQKCSRPGLAALREVAQINGPIGVYEIGFQLGPRLNAAGRLETAQGALDLLLADSPQQAATLAQQLDFQNCERQRLERAILQEAQTRLRSHFNPETDPVIVDGDASWHIGVVGIVAARLQQEYYRPTFIFGGDGQSLRGSGRSVAGFDLAAALRECAHLLLRFGGHAMAAGVSLVPENLAAFRTQLGKIASRQLAREQLLPPLVLDAEVTLQDLTPECIKELSRLKPFGQQNPPVQLCCRRLTNARAPVRVGREQKHVKFWVTDGQQTCEAIWWNGGDALWPTGQFDLAFIPQTNVYNGATQLQLKLIDWRASE